MCFVMQCKVKMQHLCFNHNVAVAGSATFISDSSEVFCKNCLLYQNQNIGNYVDSTAISIYGNSMMNVSRFKCKKHRGYSSSCISVTKNCTVFISDAILSMNIGCTISLIEKSHLVIVNSYFFNNLLPNEGNGVIVSLDSTLDVTHCCFFHNGAYKGGSILLLLSTAVLNNCTFNNNSNTAVVLKNTTTSFVNCTFENNSNPLHCGALSEDVFSVVNVSHSTFLNNSGSLGGVISVNRNSSALINNCSFSANTCIFETHVSQNNKNITLNGGGGAILIRKSMLRVFQSTFYNNHAVLA